VLVRIEELAIIVGEASSAQIAEAIAWVSHAPRHAGAQMGLGKRTRLSMPKRVLPRITAVTPGEQPATLRVTWDQGDESLVDLSSLIQTFRAYAPLRQSPELFRQVRVGEHGTDIVWTDEIDMAADTLWRLA